MTAVLTVIGWAGKRFSGKLDKHMEKVEDFMGNTRESSAIVKVRLDNSERRLDDHDKRIGVAQQVHEIHGIVREMHDKGCGATA